MALLIRLSGEKKMNMNIYTLYRIDNTEPIYIRVSTFPSNRRLWKCVLQESKKKDLVSQLYSTRVKSMAMSFEMKKNTKGN